MNLLDPIPNLFFFGPCHNTLILAYVLVVCVSGDITWPTDAKKPWLLEVEGTPKNCHQSLDAQTRNWIPPSLEAARGTQNDRVFGSMVPSKQTLSVFGMFMKNMCML